MEKANCDKMARLQRELAAKLSSEAGADSSNSTATGPLKLLTDWVEQADAVTAANRAQTEVLTKLASETPPSEEIQPRVHAHFSGSTCFPRCGSHPPSEVSDLRQAPATRAGYA